VLAVTSDDPSAAPLSPEADPRDGPTGSIDQREIDTETNAELDEELEESFPSSDPPSSWAGSDS
jgi:hypothetical protein